ncbi:YXWGXW repeat-containing protein [Mucilaginibacter sp. RS28]|uniref:YXWGXW repeat-containing protein n=1 Tax=Mucilaginibacter straminoryzae TaxID=2932774 RepID=A0A9X2BBH9_9SPHI|nr:YXWGXW repeat-containing protein [Mucilaginibacter straminoryzae]MCJ8211770.1 YXWGXW repeat-containing protein [Mucilaginibacter straminoryzae]
MKKLLKTGLIALVILLVKANVFAQISVGISISAHVAPPPLPVYAQPPCPVDGYLWVPGYWAWSDDIQDYYWVPGVWMAPPRPGLLWTPAYWGYTGGVYGFHAGYWGIHVGFYGGINYGYGYCGTGFVGGGWSGDHFRYNTAVVNVNKTVIHNTYIDESVNVHNTVVNNNRVSFNGGQGGVQAQPRAEELAAMREQHVQATAQQSQHEQHAMQDRSQFFKNNGGRPERAAVNKVGGAQVRAANYAPGDQHGFRQPADRGANPAGNNAMDYNHRDNQLQRPDGNHNMANQPQPDNRTNAAYTPGNHVLPNRNYAMQQQHMHSMPQPHVQAPHSMPHNMPRPPQMHAGRHH